MLDIGTKTNYGIVEDVYKNQYQINSMWVHETLVTPVSKVSKENIIKKLQNGRGTEYITLYHGTDIQSYDIIMNSGFFGDGEHIYFFTSNKSEAKEYSNNKAKYRGKEQGKVITFKMPKYAVQQNRATGEYETEFKLKYNGDVWIPEL